MVQKFAAALIFSTAAVMVVAAHPVAPKNATRQGDLVYMDLPGYGQIIGKQEQTFSGKPIHAYRGIPFSKAKRFERFADPEPWTDPLDATAYGLTCHDLYENEDTSANCLSVNVYVSNWGAEPSTVLVYVHGGGFVYGDSTGRDLKYFLESDIVAVTFNYRIGPLGFLESTDPDLNLPGNYGLMDQIEALRWVQRNIAAFGGNPNDVALFGSSAGAASVDLLTLIPHETEGLFHRVLSFSGSGPCPWAIQGKPQDAFIKYAGIVGCLADGEDPSAATYDCLRSKDLQTMMSSWGSEFQVWSFLPFVFVPSIDGELLRDTPENLLADGYFVRVPMLAGVDRDEGFMISGDSVTSLDAMADLRDNWLSYCPIVFDLERLEEEDALRACTLASEYYMNSEEIDYQNYYEFIRMATTRLFHLPQQRSAMAHASYAPYYGYRNEYQAARGPWTYTYVGVPEEVPRLASGIPHVGETPMIFPDTDDPIMPGEEDEWVHKFFMGAFRNFVLTGVPTIPDELNYDLEWPQFTPEHPRIQIIDKFPRISTRFVPKDEEDFWISVGL